MKHTEFIIPDKFIDGKLAIKVNSYEDLVSFLLHCDAEGLNVNPEKTLLWAFREFSTDKCVYLRHGTNFLESIPRVTGIGIRGTRYSIIDLDDLRTDVADATDILDLL